MNIEQKKQIVELLMIRTIDLLDRLDDINDEVQELEDEKDKLLKILNRLANKGLEMIDDIKNTEFDHSPKTGRFPA